jgi:hypothetical protein
LITGIKPGMEIRRERRKPGRPAKGDRVFTGVRLPREYRVAAEELARRDGLDVTDVVTRMVGESLGLPIPDYCLPKTTSQQEELPLNKAS